MSTILIRRELPPVFRTSRPRVRSLPLAVVATVLVGLCGSLVPATGLPGAFGGSGGLTAAPAGGVPRRLTLLPSPAAAPGPGATGDSRVAHTTVTYGSWGAGFVADAPAGESFTALSARFIAPEAPRQGATGWVAIWGGIGLAAPSGDELMQAGVSLQSTGGGAWQATIPWWIDEPQAPTEPHVMSVTIHPGDTVEVDLGRAAGGQWAFRLTDLTTGGEAVGSCSACHSDGQTAAWVVEDPVASTGAGQTGFADPGSVVFLNASASLDSGRGVSLGRLDWHPLVRASGTGQQAPRTAPGAGGSFTVADVSAGGGQ